MAETAPKTNVKNTKPFNLLTRITINQVQTMEDLIQQICKDFPEVKDKEQEMIEKYIHKEEKMWKKMVRKCKPKKTRSKSGYTIFLSDPVIIDKIKEENKDIMMKNLNPYKGKMWKKIKANDTKLFERYEKVAQLFKHNLISYDDKDQDEVRNLIKIWMYKKSLSELDKLLETIPKEEPKKKTKAKSKPKKSVKKISHDDSGNETDDESDDESEDRPSLSSVKNKKRIMDSDDDSDSDKEEKYPESESDSESSFDLDDTEAY